MLVNRRRLALGAGVGSLAVAGLAAGVGPSVAGSSSGSEATERPKAAQAGGAAGRFSLVMMVHTRSSSFGDLPGTRPWDGRLREGTSYEYRSIPCKGNAPVNNIASDLPSYGTRVTGSRAPSSMRAHPFGFELRKNRRGKWELLGAVRFTVCHLRPGPTPSNDPVADEDKPYISVGFRARVKRETRELVRWHGRFRIAGGSGRYSDLVGRGRIAGYFFCFAPEGCSAHDRYLDGQFVMHGTYSDPTADLATSG